MQYTADMVHRKLAGLPWAQDDAAQHRNDQYGDLLQVAWERWDPDVYRSTNYVRTEDHFESWAVYVEYIKGLLTSVRGEIIES
jgi:hypothetical protein